MRENYIKTKKSHRGRRRIIQRKKRGRGEKDNEKKTEGSKGKRTETINEKKL